MCSNFTKGYKIVQADKSNSNMILGELNKENLKSNLDKLKENEIAYFIIENIDELDSKQQEKYINLIKNREFRGYNIPENVIIVITIKSKENMSKIISELYHFCVVVL